MRIDGGSWYETTTGCKLRAVAHTKEKLWLAMLYDTNRVKWPVFITKDFRLQGGALAWGGTDPIAPCLEPSWVKEDGKPFLSPELIAALPEWANWVAMDCENEWKWFAREPKPDHGYWWSTFAGGYIPDAFAPDWTGDWRDSLVEVVR